MTKRSETTIPSPEIPKNGRHDTFTNGCVPGDDLVLPLQLTDDIGEVTRSLVAALHKLPATIRVADVLKEGQNLYGERTTIRLAPDPDQVPPVPHRIVPKKAVRTITTTGARLTRLTRLGMSAESHRLFVRPVIADIQFEYGELRAAGQPLRARWILIRGYASVLPGWLYGLVARAVRRMFSA